MRKHLNRNFFSIMSIAIFVSGFLFINQAKGQERLGESQKVTQNTFDRIRVVISTSGPVEFRSYWQEDPYRLVVEFQSMNVTSKLDNEVVVNRGVLKRITSEYQDNSLKALTFELSEVVPYKIWQEDNAILLDLQTPIGTEPLIEQVPLTTLVFGERGKEIFTMDDTDQGIIKRLEVMDTAIAKMTKAQSPLEAEKQVSEFPPPLEVPQIETTKKPREEIDELEKEIISPQTLPKTKTFLAAAPLVAESPGVKKGMMGMIFWFGGLTLISGTGFLAWRRHKSNVIKKLKLDLEEKNKLLEQEEVIRKAIEEASLKKEKEYEGIKNSFGSLKDQLIKKGLVRRELSPEEKERPWIPGETQERRYSPRLSLTRDYNKTIILRIESPNTPQNIKFFANNISFEGLCFETKKEFNEGELLNLRLFFYGDKVPMLKAQALITWKKTVGQDNYYGVIFDLLEEKDQLELNRYIESKISET